MKMFQTTLATSIFGAFGLMIATPAASAATVGYWRFENSPGFLADSSGNDFTLTSQNAPTASNSPTQEAIPAIGNGSNFPTTIPQTGGSNASLANLIPSSGFFSVDDPDPLDANNSFDTAFDVSDFTIEAYANRETTPGGSQYFASRSQSQPGQRGYSFGVAGGGAVGAAAADTLFALVSDDGNSNQLFASGLTFLANTDYFVALSFDESDQAAGVTFYLQDLTNGGALLSSTLAHGIVSLNDTNAPFRIGGFDGVNDFNGRLDEVRFSNSVLLESELLNAVPEPASMALVGLGGLMMLSRRRSA